MLDGRAHPVRLDAADIGGGHLSGEQRVLGEILEVTSVQRVTMDVHTRSEEDVHPVLEDFIAHRLRHLLHEGDVPGTGQEGTHREAGAVKRSVRTRAGGLDAKAGGAVGQDGARNAQPVDGPCVAGGAGDFGRDAGRDAVHDGGTGATHQQGGLFLQGHGLEDFFDVVLRKPGLRRCGEGQAQGKDGQKGFLHI